MKEVACMVQNDPPMNAGDVAPSDIRPGRHDAPNDIELVIHVNRDDRRSTEELLNEHGSQITWVRHEERFSGDPQTVLAVAIGITSLLSTINRIAHSWRRDVVIDIRRKQITVSSTGSRNGNVIVTRKDGKVETFEAPISDARLPRLLRQMARRP